MNLIGESAEANAPGVKGENTAGGDGVVGIGRRGVVGDSDTFQGVFGKSRDNAGIVGESAKFHAIFGKSHDPNSAGAIGINRSLDDNEQGFGVIGRGRIGVFGESTGFQGVFGTSRDNAGVAGESTKFHAVFGNSHDANSAGVFASNDNGGFGLVGISEKGIGVKGAGGQLAALFEGHVEVIGKLTVNGIEWWDLLREQMNAGFRSDELALKDLDERVKRLEGER